MKTTLIACRMLEDELKYVLKKTDSSMPVVWMERGYHNTPDLLRQKLQEAIDSHQDQDCLLLAYGLCGNGLEGITSAGTALVLPRFDDCINMLLCTGARRQRGLTRARSFYLTGGWTRDNEAILQKHQEHIEQYGEEMADYILETMYSGYESLSIIDTGCYELKPVQAYAEEAGRLLDLAVEKDPGSVRILEQLISGPWDNNFIVQEPGAVLVANQWDF